MFFLLLKGTLRDKHREIDVLYSQLLDLSVKEFCEGGRGGGERGRRGGGEGRGGEGRGGGEEGRRGGGEGRGEGRKQLSVDGLTLCIFCKTAPLYLHSTTKLYNHGRYL